MVDVGCDYNLLCFVELGWTTLLRLLALASLVLDEFVDVLVELIDVGFLGLEPLLQS